MGKPQAQPAIELQDFSDLRQPAKAPEPTDHQLLVQIRDLLQAQAGVETGATQWAQWTIDLAAGSRTLIARHKGRKSLSINNAGPGKVAVVADTLTPYANGMPIAVNGERTFTHGNDLYLINGDTQSAHLLLSEEWQP